MIIVLYCKCSSNRFDADENSKSINKRVSCKVQYCFRFVARRVVGLADRIF